MSKRVRIGFVGVGNMGQMAHLRNYHALQDECEVVALAEPRPQLAQKVAVRYGIQNVYSSADEMLQNEQLDGLVASQPFDRHGQIILPLYQHGLPIFTEKPLAASTEVGEQMINALETGGSWHMVGYHKRSDPAVMWAKERIEVLKASGALGALRYIRILMPAGDWIQNGFYDLITTDETPPMIEADTVSLEMDEATLQEYVSFVNYYIHQVNLLRHLLGESYRVTFADPSGVLLVAESESGVCGTIEMSPYVTKRDWQESATVCFEHGFISVELPSPLALNQAGRVTFFSDPGGGAEPQTVSPTLPFVHAMKQQALHFIKAIRGEMQPMCDAREALEDLKIARQYLNLKKRQ